MSVYILSSKMPAWLRHTATVLAFVVGLHGLSPLSYGRPIMSAPIAMEDARSADLAIIQQMLEQKVVQHRLGELGYTKNEIQSRLAHASSAELHQLAVQSEVMLAGGDAGVGLLVTILVVILLVILILRIASNETGDDPEMMAA